MLKKIISLAMAIVMMMSFSTMFISAATPRAVTVPKSWIVVGESITIEFDGGNSNATWASGILRLPLCLIWAL